MHAIVLVPLVHGIISPVPSSHTSVVIGSEPLVSIGAPQLPSSPVLEPYHLQSPRLSLSSSICSQPEVEDECLTPEVRLHIAFEVVSQLHKTQESRWLSPAELSLHEFLVEQIRSLQMVAEAQDDAPSLTQASIAPAQVTLPPQPEVEDECLKSEVLLHIAFEVISQFDKAEESRWLSPKELSLCDFPVEQTRSLQMVIEAQDDAPSLTQASMASAQDPLPLQPAVALVGRCSGVVALISLAPPVRDDGQVVDLSVFSSCGRDAMLSPPYQ
jgi:hypothetical protein